jgi:predicted transposase YbfD/YdcC
VGGPSEPTIRRTLGRLDAEALVAAIGAWLTDRNRERPDQWRRAVAVDGKTLRGARAPGGREVHLLAAMDHTARAVLAQRQVAGAPGEVPAFAPLLDGLDLAGGVVTADALQAHPQAAEFLVDSKQAHYLFGVKANQPTLLDRCVRLPWHRVPVADRTRDRGHGRVELRTLKAVTVHHFGFPHAAQVVQVTRRTRELRTRRWPTVTVYAITSLPFEQANPARLADLLRGHWAIEALHTFGTPPSLRTPLRSAPAPAARHGLPAQPRYRGAVPGRAGQPRRRPPTPRPRPRPAPGHPRDHPRLNRTLRENAGAWAPRWQL